jgi:hypothetical protein
MASIRHLEAKAAFNDKGDELIFSGTKSCW